MEIPLRRRNCVLELLVERVFRTFDRGTTPSPGFQVGGLAEGDGTAQGTLQFDGIVPIVVGLYRVFYEDQIFTALFSARGAGSSRQGRGVRAGLGDDVRRYEQKGRQ
jgi:hypothetical protein